MRGYSFESLTGAGGVVNHIASASPSMCATTRLWVTFRSTDGLQFDSAEGVRHHGVGPWPDSQLLVPTEINAS